MTCLVGSVCGWHGLAFVSDEASEGYLAQISLSSSRDNRSQDRHFLFFWALG